MARRNGRSKGGGAQLPLLDATYEVFDRDGVRYAGPFGTPGEALKQVGRKGAVIVQRKPLGDRVEVYEWRGGKWKNLVGGD